jgi:hypothetical protein
MLHWNGAEMSVEASGWAYRKVGRTLKIKWGAHRHFSATAYFTRRHSRWHAKSSPVTVSSACDQACIGQPVLRFNLHIRYDTQAPCRFVFLANLMASPRLIHSDADHRRIRETGSYMRSRLETKFPSLMQQDYLAVPAQHIPCSPAYSNQDDRCCRLHTLWHLLPPETMRAARTNPRATSL